MTAEQLRNSILQEAISGRLVPQDPNDEPASALLARIREEKARLAKDGKLKKEKPSSPITEDEIPFEIPESWEWIRFGDYMEIIGGYAFPSESLKAKEGPRVVRISDISEKGFVNKSIVRYKGNPIPDTYRISQFDILIAMTGGTVGKSLLVPELSEEMYLNQRVANIRNHWFDIRYVDTVIKAPHIKEIINERKNSTNDNISMVDIKNFLLPLPPLAEQQRIVAKLEELLPLVEQYGKAQTELDQLNAALPARLRQSILQQAIQGKLVPQDPNDEHENITAFENEEPPFEIPSNWKWCLLGDLVEIISGTSYKKGDVRNNGIRILRGGNISNDELVLANDDVFLSQEYASPDKMIRKDDIIIVASTGSQKVIGKPALIRQDYKDIQIGAFLRIIRAKNIKYIPYIWLIFKGMYYREHIRSLVKGTNINNIKEEYITKLTIPLPPLAEQQRIVAKIEELFAEIDKLAK